MNSEIESPVLSEAIGIRFPNDLKPEILTLMKLEDRKFGNVVISLIKQYLPIKRRVHEQRNNMDLIKIDSSTEVSFNRTPIEGEDYDASPGLRLIIVQSEGRNICDFILTKEAALKISANLSIFLNEVNL